MKYQYEAKTATGENIKGTLEAGNLTEAKMLLAKKEFFLTKIGMAGGEIQLPSGISNLFNKIKSVEKLMFTQEMAVMIKAGFPITKALATLKAQSKNPKFKEILGVIEHDVRGGISLSEALAKHPKVFPNIYTQAVAAGEESGNLDKIMERLAVDMHKSYELTSKIRSAMAYPIFVLVAMVLILIAMLIFVLPQLKTLFEDMNIALPLLTRVLLSLSGFFLKFWWAIILIILGIYLAWQAYYKTASGKYAVDKLKIKIWIFGSINQKIYLLRFTRNLNTLISAGLPILQVFDTLAKTVGNQLYASDIAKARKDIEGGKTISEALATSKYFSPLVIQLIKVGEESGNISNTLDTISDFLESEVDNATKSLSSLIEPLLMLILGIGAGFIIAAIIMPIYSLTSVIT